MAARMNGIVMNGPIPTMSIMFRAMPRQRPMSRRSSGMEGECTCPRPAVGDQGLPAVIPRAPVAPPSRADNGPNLQNGDAAATTVQSGVNFWKGSS